MCFKFIKSGHKGCSKGVSCKYTYPKLCHSSLFPYYHISVTVLNAISIMLQTQLGQTSIKTYPELLYLKDQLLTQLP